MQTIKKTHYGGGAIALIWSLVSLPRQSVYNSDISGVFLVTDNTHKLERK